MALDYTFSLQNLLPIGAMWTRESSANITKLLQALGDEFGRVEDRVTDLLAEFYPDTLDELLSDWERVLGLPDDCYTPTTTTERRAAVKSKLALRGGQSEDYFIALAAASGYVITIDRHPYDFFQVGSSAVGDALSNDAWQFVWIANADPLVNVDLLECVLENATQAHTVVVVEQ